MRSLASGRIGIRSACRSKGDWYARGMYRQGQPQYEYHVKHYGHPSVFGYKDICHLWKAERWDPDALIQLYKKAGAKYMVALANHHDNFDCWDSKYQPWNAVNVGPKRDIVGRMGESGARAWAALWRELPWDAAQDVGRIPAGPV
jgi:alpha-L-fucosidase